MADLDLKWVACDGGPLLLLAEKYIHAWEGTNIPAKGHHVQARFRWNPGGPATDYDRACDVEDYLGLIRVDEAQALVLSDAPFATTWFPSSDGGVFIRWVYADSDAEVMDAFNRIPDEAYKDTELSLSVEDSTLVLFAACESGDEQIYSRLQIQLPLGRYRIFTCEYEESERTSIICHRLRRIEECA